MKNLFRSVTLSAIALASVAVAANAQTITQTASIGPGTSVSAGGALVPAFNKFDTMGGTRVLDSVTYSQAGTVTITYTIKNNDVSAANVSVGFQYSINDSALPDGYSIMTKNPAGPAFDSATIGSLAAGATTSGSLTSNFSSGLLTSSSVSSFIGAGTFSVNILSSGTAFASGGANLSSTITQTYGKTLTLNYNYSPRQTGGTPEPSAVAFAAIAGASMVGMMVRARRRG